VNVARDEKYLYNSGKCGVCAEEWSDVGLVQCSKVKDKQYCLCWDLSGLQS